MKYATVFKRTQSSYYSIAYWCPVAQKRIFKTTPFHNTDPNGHRKALALANEKSKYARADKEVGGTDRLEHWVEAFLKERYRGRTTTLGRYLYGWSQRSTFLHERGLNARGLRTRRGGDGSPMSRAGHPDA
jgi:hypothetical protein